MFSVYPSSKLLFLRSIRTGIFLRLVTYVLGFRIHTSIHISIHVLSPPKPTYWRKPNLFCDPWSLHSKISISSIGLKISSRSLSLGIPLWTWKSSRWDSYLLLANISSGSGFTAFPSPRHPNFPTRTCTISTEGEKRKVRFQRERKLTKFLAKHFCEQKKLTTSSSAQFWHIPPVTVSLSGTRLG